MTTRESSGMYPVWAKTARDFSLRLDGLTSGRALFLAKRMREFVKEFETWESETNPSPEEQLRRRKVVTEYMTCYRDTLDVLGSRP